jgi:hypothetical protein
MKTTSVKRIIGLAIAAVSTSGAMLAPTVANAATAHPAHPQTAPHVAKAIHVSRCCGIDSGWGYGGWGS